MKVLNKSVIAARGEIEHTRTEKEVLSKLNHPFLAKLHWSFQTEVCGQEWQLKRTNSRKTSSL